MGVSGKGLVVVSDVGDGITVHVDVRAVDGDLIELLVSAAVTRVLESPKDSTKV
jgi:hypothetical protein